MALTAEEEIFLKKDIAIRKLQEEIVLLQDNAVNDLGELRSLITARQKQLSDDVLVKQEAITALDK